MKQLTIIIVGTLSLFACNNSKNHVAQKSDTLKTIVKYIWPNNGALVENYSFRITKDSLVTVKDTSGNKITIDQEWKRIVVYSVPIMDSIREGGKVKYDSVTRSWLRLVWVELPTKYIYHDYNLNTLNIFNSEKH